MPRRSLAPITTHALAALLGLAALALAAAPGPAARADEPSACAPALPYEVAGFRDPRDELSRLAELAGAAPLRPRVFRRGGLRLEERCLEGPATPWAAREPASEDPATGPSLRPLPLYLETVFNTHFPSQGNDGLLWAGRGASALVAGGVAGRYGPLSYALAPELTWSQNRSFALVPTGEPGDLQFRNPWYGDEIDLPQRFGNGGFAAWAPGQSYLRVDAGNVGAGISSENLWFGPGGRSSIIMSNAAPGFPHVFVGTSRPADIGIGALEVQALWGRLERTTYEANPTHPLITALVLDYSPKWVPGLTLGLSRVHLQVWDNLHFADYFPFLTDFQKKNANGDGNDPTNPTNNPKDNQLASLYGRWSFPAAGVEVWAEWAREDHEYSFAQVTREPDHSQATQFGLQKVFVTGSRWVRLLLETTNLQQVRPLAAERGMPTYYVHPNDLSYTNRGQLLGAWIGPGGSSQIMAIDVFHPGGRIGGYVERVRRNDAIFWAQMEPLRQDISHDTEITGAVRQLLFAGPVEVGWEVAASYRWSREFQGNEPNFRATVQVGYRAP